MKKIRRAGMDDLDEICTLYQKAKEQLKKEGHHHWDNAYNVDYIAKLIQEKETYVLHENKSLVGVQVISSDRPSYYIDSDNMFWENPDAKSLYLSGLVVHPDHVGKGYASSLIAFVENQARDRNIPFIRFDAVESFPKLKEIYEKKGYIIKGRRAGKNKILQFFEKSVL